jgi:hypothetical protein
LTRLQQRARQDLSRKVGSAGWADVGLAPRVWPLIPQVVFVLQESDGVVGATASSCGGFVRSSLERTRSPEDLPSFRIRGFPRTFGRRDKRRKRVSVLVHRNNHYPLGNDVSPGVETPPGV